MSFAVVEKFNIDKYGNLYYNQIIQREEIKMSLNVWNSFKKEDIYLTCVSKIGHCPVLVFAERFGEGKYRSITTGEEYLTNLNFDDGKNYIGSYCMSDNKKKAFTLAELSKMGQMRDINLPASDGEKEDGFKLIFKGNGTLFNLLSDGFDGGDLSKIMGISNPDDKLTRLQVAQIEWYTNRYLQNQFSSSNNFKEMIYRSAFFPPFGDDSDSQFYGNEFPTENCLCPANFKIGTQEISTPITTETVETKEEF